MKKKYTGLGPPVVVIAIVIAILSIVGAPTTLAANDTNAAHQAIETTTFTTNADYVGNQSDLVDVKKNTTTVLMYIEVAARTCPNGAQFRPLSTHDA